MPQDAEPSDRVSLAHDVRGRGSPLVLIAGTGYPGATWHPGLVDGLAERHTVVSFDHRGTGRTPGTPGPYSTRLFAADVAGLLDELGFEEAHVLGHSMGGRVAQWLALDAPGRVRSLILAASGPGQFDPAHHQVQGIPLATALGLIEKGYERYMRDQISGSFFTIAFADAHPEAVEWLIQAFWSNRPSLEEYLKHVAARQEHRTTERLTEIAQPTLVLIGDADTHVGGTGSHWDQSQYLADRIPNAELRVIPDAKHGLFWSHPEPVVQALSDWMDGFDASESTLA